MNEECEICFEIFNKKKLLACSHSLCYGCYHLIGTKCPFCRQVIIEKEELDRLDNDPTFYHNYEPEEYILYSKYFNNGKEEIKIFRKNNIPKTWRNDPMATIVKNKRRVKSINKNENKRIYNKENKNKNKNKKERKKLISI